MVIERQSNEYYGNHGTTVYPSFILHHATAGREVGDHLPHQNCL
jgi:hypothetical protein